VPRRATRKSLVAYGGAFFIFAILTFVKNFSFSSKVWLYPSETAAWHFASVPKEESEQIKKMFGANARGFGSLRVEATIGKTKWRTSIFPDKRSGTYLLPLKKKVRNAEGVYEGDSVKIILKIV
jgi:hypothetical protein